MRAAELHWVVTLLASLVDARFYGDVTLSFQSGSPTLARVSQTHKPEARPFKEMTVTEYTLHQELDKFLGGQHGS